MPVFEVSAHLSKKECVRARPSPPYPYALPTFLRSLMTVPFAPSLVTPPMCDFLGLFAHAALPVVRRNTKLRKAESMVHYWDARVPFWNGKGSHADIKGQETRAFIADLEAKARKRYDALY